MPFEATNCRVEVEFTRAPSLERNAVQFHVRRRIQRLAGHVRGHGAARNVGRERPPLERALLQFRLQVLEAAMGDRRIGDEIERAVRRRQGQIAVLDPDRGLGPIRVRCQGFVDQPLQRAERELLAVIGDP